MLDLEYGLQLTVWLQCSICLGNRCHIRMAHDALANSVQAMLNVRPEFLRVVFGVVLKIYPAANPVEAVEIVEHGRNCLV